MPYPENPFVPPDEPPADPAAGQPGHEGASPSLPRRVSGSSPLAGGPGAGRQMLGGGPVNGYEAQSHGALRRGLPGPGPGRPDDAPGPEPARRFPEQNAPGWVPAPPASFAPGSRPGFTPPPEDSYALWEPWEPPSEPIGAVRDDSYGTEAEPEYVRGQEYEDELSLWEASRPGGPGGPRRGRHARRARRRQGRAAMVIAGVLAAAGAVPLSLLAVRTLDHHKQAPVTTAPLAHNQSAGSASGQGGAAKFTATAGPGCSPVASATTDPYQAPNGDGWHLSASTTSGPCGSAFVYSYLAMVPGSPGEWHDHYAWTFRTGLSSPSCTMSIYIPAAPQANSTVYYWFSAGSPNAVNRIADFTIDQATHRGQWVSHGPFTFPGGTVLVEATDRGEGPATAAAAVGPVRVTC